MNERRVGIFISYFNIILQVVIAMVYVPMLLKYIGTSEYGIYQLIGSLIAYFSVMDFGLTSTIIRFYTKYKAVQDRISMENILAIAMRGFIVITAIILIIGIVVYFFIDDIFNYSMTSAEIKSAKNLFILLLVNVMITLLTMTYKAIINAHEKFFFLKIIESFQLILQPILVWVILQQYPFAFSVAMVQTILNVALTLIRIYYCYFYLHIKVKFHYWNDELRNSIGKLAFSTFVVAIVDQIFFRTNQVILGVINGTSAVAIYSIVALIYINYMSLSWAISGVYLPHVTEMISLKRPKEEISNLFIKVGYWQFLILGLFLSGFILYGKEFINIWAGKEFLDAYWATVIILVPFTVDLIENIAICIMQAKNTYGFRARTYFIMGIFNIILGIPAAHIYGVMGCAVVTGLMMFLGNGLVMNYYYKKYLYIDIKSFWFKISNILCKIIILMLITAFIRGCLIDFGAEFTDIKIFIISIVTYAILYILTIYFFVFTANEKKIINSRFSRLGKI